MSGLKEEKINRYRYYVRGYLYNMVAKDVGSKDTIEEIAKYINWEVEQAERKLREKLAEEIKEQNNE